uniref:Uncharacterized protein n=1 Tax=Arcella intermedia TaxID=1963864 RepID=A0A6B2L583_9EUKA
MELKHAKEQEKSSHKTFLSCNWRQLFQVSMEFVRSQIFCFYTKVDFNSAVLGVPINIKYAFNGELKETYIQSIEAYLELLSVNSFMEGHRLTIWRKPFTHLLPIYLCGSHWSKARSVFEGVIKDIARQPEHYTPVLAAEIICKIMNTMVVSVMNQTLHLSLQYLQGYVYFYRILLQLVVEDSSLQELIERKIGEFVEEPLSRDKWNVPALGEWLPLLTVSLKYSWHDVAPAYLTENFDRNAKWILKEAPHLRYNLYSTDIDWERIKTSFHATKVSNKLLMFHVYFLKTFAKPPNMRRTEIIDAYDSFYNQISHEQQQIFLDEVNKIKNLQTWSEFFLYIDYPEFASPATLSQLLKDSIIRSQNKEYHQPRPRNNQPRNRPGKPKNKLSLAEFII